MAQELSTNSGTDVVGPELERELDRLSVEQALRDFEIANARTIDVTQRLVDLSTEVRELREQLVSTQEALAASRAENNAIRASATFRVAELTTKIRARLRR
jgi:predicted  nucleic acid-binding Zn-ribbon protein